MQQLMVVLPFCHRDAERALELVAWIGKLNRKLDNPCLLIADAKAETAIAQKIVSKAESIFSTCALIRPSRAIPDETWPTGANLMFETAAQHMGKMQGVLPWLWLEPDVVPMAKNWLSDIEFQYFRGKRSYMGQIYRPTDGGLPRQMLSGIAVYPACLPTPMLNILTANPRKAWDVSCANIICSDAFHSPLFWNFYNQSLPPTFVAVREQIHPRNAITLSEIPPAAVLVHPSKDGSLIRLLAHRRDAEVKAALAERMAKKIIRPKPAFKFEGCPSITQQTEWPCGLFFIPSARDTQTVYFNPTIATIKGVDYLIPRRSVQQKQPGVWKNDLGIFRLGRNMVITEMQFPVLPTRFQWEQWDDPRAVVVNDELYVGCAVWAHGPAGGWKSTPINVHQVFAHALPALDRLEMVMRPQYGHNHLHVGPTVKFEKNWTWFHRDGEWYFVYVPSPFHTVVRIGRNGALTEHKIGSDNRPHWNYGDIRGGTNPVLHDGEYWTFFHSSVSHRQFRLRYFGGAYAFEAKPPFRMTRITQAPLFVASDKDARVWGGPLCFWPAGALLRDGIWTLVAGVNDEACFWAHIPHEDMLKRMYAI